MPESAAWATTARRLPWVAGQQSAKRGANIRFAAPPSSAWAMSSRSAERMMQPARQTRAMPASGSDQPNSGEAAASRPKPWA